MQLSTPGQRPQAVAIGVATALVVTVLAVARTFVRTATRLNGVTTTIAANLVEAKDAAKDTAAG